MMLYILIFLTTLLSQESLASEFSRDHCETIVIQKLRIERMPGRSGDHYLSDGKDPIARFKTREAAFYALSKMKDLNLSIICYESKQEREFTFFLTGLGKKPIARDNSNDRCEKLILPLQVKEERRLFSRYFTVSSDGDSRNPPLSFGNFETATSANMVISVINKFRFNSFCQDRARPSGFYWLGILEASK